jgi:hypothetical protein
VARGQGCVPVMRSHVPRMDCLCPRLLPSRFWCPLRVTAAGSQRTVRRFFSANGPQGWQGRRGEGTHTREGGTGKGGCTGRCPHACCSVRPLLPFRPGGPANWEGAADLFAVALKTDR